MINAREMPPNPGSDEALARGCKCPVLDNHHGRGAYHREGLFFIAGGCPLHDPLIRSDSALAQQGTNG